MANSISDEIAKQRSKLVEGQYGNQSSPYSDTFGQAYANLQQPFNPNDSNQSKVAIGGTQALASSFVDEFYKQFGKLPTEDQMKSFVGENLTPSFAQKFIQGLNTDQMVSQYVKPYVTANAQDLATGAGVTTTNTQDALQSKVDALYGQARAAIPAQVEDYWNPQKAKIAQDLAAQGLLNQPVSRLTFNQLEGGKQRATTEALAGLAGQEATGQVDLAKTLAGLQENARQFGITSGLQRQQFLSGQDQYQNNLALQRQQLGLARQLGQLQADANKPGTLDYINTAFGGLGALGGLYGAYKKA